MKSKFLFIFGLFCCLTLIPYLTWGQEGITISGKIIDADGQPLPGANVLIQRTNLGAAANINGDYSFTVPASAVRNQEVNLEARFIGYHSKVEKVVLAPGSDLKQDFTLKIDVLDMDAIVVTGVVDATPKAKMAVSTAVVSSEALEKVPASDPAGALYGKVAGVKVIQGNGQPGTAPTVTLRAPTSIDARGRSQQPLFIVDGVVIDPSITGSPLDDIPGEEIESIEVVKGAAGASLYGARAANGVIRITTKRGDNLGLNQTRIRVRNEFGFNDLEREISINKHHNFKVAGSSYTDANGFQVNPGDFIDDDGNFVDPRQPGARAEDHYADPNEFPQAAGFSFYDNDYKYVATGNVGDPLIELKKPFNQLDRFFDPGSFVTNTVSVSRNMEDTNFLVSFTNYQESGVVDGIDGIRRRSVRVNVDHKFKRTLSLGVSGLFSQSKRDLVDGSDPFFALTFMAPDADISMRDDEGNLFIQPDPYSVEDNPLNFIQNNDRDGTRRRVMGSFNLRWAPLNEVNIEGNFSYDRSDRRNDFFWPIGFQSITSGPEVLGRLDIGNFFDEALNGSVTGSFSKQFGEFVLRTKARGLFERAEFRMEEADGRDLGVRGTRSLSTANNEVSFLDSQLRQVRSNGYSFIAGFDYKDRYIADFLVRRDGSSLFGPDERWQTYFRLSGAYRLSQEPWWFIPAFNEFKIRASYGTAGGRPNFFARFETFSVSAGNVSKQNLGNKKLKPEFSKEFEIGLDAVLLERITLAMTYARSDVRDQILFAPLPAFTGFSRRWINAGKLETRVFETDINASLVQKRNFSWTAGFNFDIPITTKIAKLDIPQYSLDPFLIKEGEDLGAIWGDRWIRDINDLPADIDRSQFQKNDDGFIVFVGDGNSFQDGISKHLWGTSGTLTDADGNEQSFNWGMPIKFTDPETGSNFVRLGSTVPDLNLGFNSSLNYKGFTVYAQFDAQIGGDIYDNTVQWGLRENKLGIVDQSGKKEGLKKPGKYYETLYNVNATNSFFVESATYLKVRELRLSYTFNRNQLSSLFGGLLNKLSIGITGRNLFTFTGYNGYDPEVGSGGFTLGSATVARFDGFGYPNFRTFTGMVEFEF